MKKNNILCEKNFKVELETLEFYNIINPNTCIVTHYHQKIYWMLLILTKQGFLFVD
jgi:hypothetical protein